MFKNQKIKEKKKNNLKKELRYYLYASLLAILGVLILYYLKFGKYALSGDQSVWANFGDFFGGVLNPILAFFAFMALLTTIKLQSEALKISQNELSATREELEKSRIAQEEQSNSLELQNKATELQSFENTFFQLNKVFNNIKSNLYIKVEKYIDDDGFFDGSGGRITEYVGIDDNDIYLLNTIKSSKIFSSEVIDKYLTILKLNYQIDYNLFNDRYEKYTGTYFAQIYQLIKFIDDNFKEKKINNPNRYINIFRAQFTKEELEFLFYHCLGIIGKRKFKKIIEDYQFFEHIVLNDNIENKILEYDINAFGKNEKLITKYKELEKESKNTK